MKTKTLEIYLPQRLPRPQRDLSSKSQRKKLMPEESVLRMQG
jgi:hypothetical protein